MIETRAAHRKDSSTYSAELEEQLRFLESRLSEAQSIAKIGSWYWNISTDNDWWSQEMYRILGFDPAIHEPSPELFAQRIHPDDLPRLDEAFKLALASREKQQVDVRIGLPDGTKKVIQCQGIVTDVDAQGRPVRMCGTLQDITERKKAEDEIRINEMRFRQAQRIAKVGSWERDVIKNEDWWSDELYSILEEDPKTYEPSFESFVAKLHPSDRKRVRNSRRKTQATGGKQDSMEVRIVLGDNRLKTVDIQVEVRSDQSGRPVSVIGTVHDITDQVALEREIVAAAENERSRIGQDLHDGLGQQLTGISLGLGALHRALVDEHSVHTQAIEHLRNIAAESITETRRIAQSLSPGPWDKLGIKQALQTLANEVKQIDGVECRYECSEENDITNCEVVSHLYRIAQESIKNALTHGNAQNIDLRYGRNEDTVYLAVIDDGIGIPAESARIEGLGLRSMRYRARMIDATLAVSARNGCGTEVRCSLQLPLS